MFLLPTEEVTLNRNSHGQLGFHIQHEGIVTEVEQYGLAGKAGLKQGSRLVEICKVAVPTMSHDQMVDLLKTSVVVTVTVIPPLKDGTPRRGCTYRNCNYSVLADIGDYENIGLSDNEESPWKHKDASSQQQTPHSRYHGQSHGRAAGRKLENQMKNAKTSPSKSSGPPLSQLNRKEEWYGHKDNDNSQDESPPPLPIRMLDSSGIIASTPPKYIEIRHPPPPSNRYNKPAPFPVPGSSIPRPSSPPSYHHHQIRQALSMPVNNAQNLTQVSSSVSHNDHLASSINQQQTNHHYTDSHPSDSDTSNYLRKSGTSLNSGTLSSGESTSNMILIVNVSDFKTALFIQLFRLKKNVQQGYPHDHLDYEVSNSRGSSPHVNKQNDQIMSKSWNVNRNIQRNQNDIGMCLTELKSTRNKNTVPSNTSTLSSQSSGSSSTFHEDLLRLIDPDLIDSQPEVALEPQRETKHRQSVEELLQEMETGSSSVNTSDNSVICTTALPAQVISSASPSPSDHKMSKEERLSPRVKSSLMKAKQVGSSSEPVIPLPIPDNEQIDWRSLVDTATKAMQVVKKNPSDTNSDSSSLKEVHQNNEFDKNAEKMQILKTKLKKLEQNLTKEQRKNETLEFEVHQLKEENIKLQEESQAAADQLRRFTEWFFQAINKQ
ncbi:Signal-induced proliferation-associated 1-like protein 3 [Nymphon striatum]|nr:Signal-induced proliferation-associated 1-like protein 3 [Nymphon striatum]